jgi:hypothetical protein
LLSRESNSQSAELIAGALLEGRRREERLRLERATVGVVVLKTMGVAYTLRCAGAHRTITISSSRCGTTHNAVHRHAFAVLPYACRTLSQGSPNPLLHWPTSPGYPPPARGGQVEAASARQLMCFHLPLTTQLPRKYRSTAMVSHT